MEISQPDPVSRHAVQVRSPDRDVVGWLAFGVQVVATQIAVPEIVREHENDVGLVCRRCQNAASEEHDTSTDNASRQG